MLNNDPQADLCARPTCEHFRVHHSRLSGCLVQEGPAYCSCQGFVEPQVAVAFSADDHAEVAARVRDRLAEKAYARTSDPDTSHAAAASLTPATLRASQAAVYAVLPVAPDGMTDEELAEAYGRALDNPRQSPSGLRSRRAELVKGGLVEDTGVRRRLASGRMSIVWGRKA